MNGSENRTSPQSLQLAYLARHGIPAARAAIVAPLAFGEGRP
jgi:hypothetical protein